MQFGVTPAHAVVLSPVAPATGRVLSLMDGTRGLPLLRRQAVSLGLTEQQVDDLVDRLSAAGLLEDAGSAGAPQEPACSPRKHASAPHRLGPDLASLSVTRREPGDPLRLMAARRAARVQVRGAGRVGTLVATVLSAAGVGQVDLVDGGCVEAADTAPGGMPESAVGRRRSEAGRQLVRRARAVRPRRAAARSADPEPPLALVVLAPRDGLRAYLPDETQAAPYLGSGTPHLFAGVIEATGVVGPLVVPGRTACAGCLRHHRTDQDPAWPRLLAQWFSGGVRDHQACEVALATAVAGLAAAHTLSFLDGRGTADASAGAGSAVRWETSLPGLGWQTRQFRPHPRCCGVAGTDVREGKGEHTSNAAHRQGTMSMSPPYAAQQSGTWRAHV